jgi:hypothetical protein
MGLMIENLHHGYYQSKGKRVSGYVCVSSRPAIHAKEKKKKKKKKKWHKNKESQKYNGALRGFVKYVPLPKTIFRILHGHRCRHAKAWFGFALAQVKL